MSQLPTTSPEWAAFEEYRKQRKPRLASDSWVAVRGDKILGVFRSFAKCTAELVRTRKGEEPLGAAYRGDSRVIHLSVGAIGR